MPIAQNHVRAAVVTRPSTSGEDQVNILWYTYNVAVALNGAQQFAVDSAQAIDAAVAPAFKACLATESLYVGVQAIVSQDGVSFSASYSSSVGPGTVVGDTLPNYGAVVVQKRTVQPGRGGRGRWYIGLVPEPLTDSNNLTQAGENAYSALATAFGQVVAANMDVQLQPSHLQGDTTLYPLIGVRPLSTLGTLRRRMVRPRF